MCYTQCGRNQLHAHLAAEKASSAGLKGQLDASNRQIRVLDGEVRLCAPLVKRPLSLAFCAPLVERLLSSTLCVLLSSLKGAWVCK